jgi:8-hydroxy-5-deazaflavin:NADPH oxidoreductase
MESFDLAPDDLRRAGAQTFLAGDDADAKRIVAQLAADLGFDSVDLGSIERARAAEALGDIVRLIMIDGSKGGRKHFRLIALPDTRLGAIGVREASKYG